MFFNTFLRIYNSLFSYVNSFFKIFTTELSLYKWSLFNSKQSKVGKNSSLLKLLQVTDGGYSYKYLSVADSVNVTKFELNNVNSYVKSFSEKTSVFFWVITLKDFLYNFSDLSRRSFSFGFYHLRALVFILFIDACLTDDEPLWEPIEWSLVQTWILFIFIFAWIAENLIVSRYGSYTGRDKRVWFSWYKTFYLIEIYYAINYGVAILFVIVPFYFELNYNLSFIFSWWHWFSRVFFFKFISLFTIVYLISCIFQMSVRWFDWKKSLFLVLIVNIFISYLLYTHFIMLFFGYFTDPIWYQKSRPIDYIQLSHEPSRWGWGPAKKDHFTYHNVKTVFWFKNDGPFASSFLLMHQFIFLSIFFLYIYWISLFRRIYSTKEVPLTFSTYCVSALKQFLYCFLMLYLLIFAGYVFNYQRLPIELLWVLDNASWLHNFANIILDYTSFLFHIFINK